MDCISVHLFPGKMTITVYILVHQYPDQMKARFEEEITKDVVDYMIYGTIMALRLDAPEKVNAYLGI